MRYWLAISVMTLACAGEFDPDLGASGGGGTTGADEGGSGTAADESQGTGGHGSGTGTTGDTATGDSGDESTTTGTDTGEIGNPEPGEPCDPIAAFEGAAPCEYPEGETGQALTCAVMQTDTDPPTLEALCVRLSDSQGDGNEWHDKCETPDVGSGADAYPCLNTHCIPNDENPNDPINGEDILPPSFCNGVGANEYARCCTMYCEPADPASPCGADMKCLAFPLLADATQPLGYCVSADYSGG